LVKEVLDKLLLKRTGSEETVEIGSEQLGDKVAGSSQSNWWIFVENSTYISSNGEMKMSLKLIICGGSARIPRRTGEISYVLVSEMLEELQFSVCALGEDGSAKGLHDLLDGNGLAGELILCRAAIHISCDVMDIAVCAWHILTRQDQMRPCLRAADRCICFSQVSECASSAAMRGVAVPACDLECRAENLGAYEFSHGDGWI
jgi:hypothetical protein